MRVRQLSILLPATMLFVIASFAADTPSPSSGKQLYQSYCGSCHGVDGKGSGPVASSLKTAPTDLTLLGKSNSGKFPEMHVIHSIEGENQVGAHGSKEMPVWGQRFRRSTGSPAEAQLLIKNLTDYLASIQAK
jgi:mono/diheme cytochrome c family protein